MFYIVNKIFYLNVVFFLVTLPEYVFFFSDFVEALHKVLIFFPFQCLQRQIKPYDDSVNPKMTASSSNSCEYIRLIVLIFQDDRQHAKDKLVLDCNTTKHVMICNYCTEQVTISL